MTRASEYMSRRIAEIESPQRLTIIRVFRYMLVNRVSISIGASMNQIYMIRISLEQTTRFITVGQVYASDPGWLAVGKKRQQTNRGRDPERNITARKPSHLTKNKFAIATSHSLIDCPISSIRKSHQNSKRYNQIDRNVAQDPNR